MITFSEAELRVKIIKAMAHPVRLMVIEFLRGGERLFSKYSVYFSSTNPRSPSICSSSRMRASFRHGKAERT